MAKVEKIDEEKLQRKMQFWLDPSITSVSIEGGMVSYRTESLDCCVSIISVEEEIRIQKIFAFGMIAGFLIAIAAWILMFPF